MGKAFWVKRFMTVFVGAFVIITCAQMIKSHDPTYSLGQGVFWGFLAASIFTATRIYRSGQGQHCAICKDTPEMRQSKSPNA